MATQVRVYEISTSAVSDLNNNEICSETVTDADLDFKMWGGKDTSGNVTRWLAKNENAQVKAFRATGNSILDGSLTLNGATVSTLLYSNASKIVTSLANVVPSYASVFNFPGLALGETTPNYKTVLDSVTIATDSLSPSGFTTAGIAATTLSFVDATRVFTITGSHTIYINGIKYTKPTASITISDTTGTHWIYYNAAGVLSEATSIPAFNLPFIATVYYNTTAGFDKGRLCNERHRHTWPWDLHQAWHDTINVTYESGLTATFADASFTITEGKIHDEDIETSIAQQTTCAVLYKNGAADFEWDEPAAIYYKLNGANLRYNNGNNLADVGANQYMAMWIFATNDTSKPIYALMGQRTDVNLQDARNNNKYESLTLGNLPSQEMKIIYRVILRNSSPNFYIETQDLRTVRNIPAGTYVATVHNALTALEWSLSGHNDTNFNVNANADGRVGVGTAAPVSKHEIYSSTAHPILTITGAHATDYDPTISFRTDAVPTEKAKIYVDSTDDSIWLTTAGIEAVIQQTGDTFGTTRLRIQNRSGSAGALFENASLDLVDFGFKPSVGGQYNQRLEHRVAQLKSALNSAGEFQFMDLLGAISFYTGLGQTGVFAGNFEVDSPTFFVNDTTHRVGAGIILPLNKLHVYSTISADGLSVDGTTFPSIVLRSSGAIIGYAPFIVTSAGGFFSGSLVGDMGFRSEANRILFGVSTAAKMIVHSTGVSYPFDGIVLYFGTDSEVTLTHVHNVGLRFNNNISQLFGTANNSAIFYDATNTVFSTLVGTATYIFDGYTTVDTDCTLIIGAGEGKNPILQFDIDEHDDIADSFRIAGVYNATSADNLLKIQCDNAVKGTFVDLVTIKTTGYVGIGTAAPTARTEIYDATDNSALTVRTYNGGLDIFNIGTTVNQFALIRMGVWGTNTPTTVDGNYIQSIALANNTPDLAFGLFTSGGTITEIFRATNTAGLVVGKTSTASRFESYITATNVAAPASSGTTPNNSIARFTTHRNNTLEIGAQYSSPYGMWLQADDITDLSVTYPLLLNPNGGYVAIGTTAPAAKLDLRDGSFYLTGASVAHGMTDYVPTTVYGDLGIFSAGNGGLQIRGWSDTDAVPLILQGTIGAADPTDTVSAIQFYAYKKNGTGIQLLAATETCFQFANAGNALVTITGAPNIGFGTTTFDASAVNYLSIKNGTEPAAHTDNQIDIGSKDSTFADTDGAVMSLRVEALVKSEVNPSNCFVPIWINGVEYQWLLNDNT